MIYQTKSTEFGEFCRYFFENLNFGQILSENLTEKHRNSRISPISLRTGKKPKPKSKSLAPTGADGPRVHVRVDASGGDDAVGDTLDKLR
jgi:hypothetical protein